MRASSPAATLQRQRDSLREQSGRLSSSIREQIFRRRYQLQAASSELMKLSPALSVQRSIGQLNQLRQRLRNATERKVAGASHKVALLGRALHSVSPLATLDRGYAIVKSEDSDAILMDTQNIKQGDNVRTRLARGEFTATVKKVHR